MITVILGIKPMANVLLAMMVMGTHREMEKLLMENVLYGMVKMIMTSTVNALMTTELVLHAIQVIAWMHREDVDKILKFLQDARLYKMEFAWNVYKVTFWTVRIIVFYSQQIVFGLMNKETVMNVHQIMHWILMEIVY